MSDCFTIPANERSYIRHGYYPVKCKAPDGDGLLLGIFQDKDGPTAIVKYNGGHIRRMPPEWVEIIE